MGLFINEDCNHFIVSRKDKIKEIDENYLNSFIDQYANTTVTDFVMNISATLSFVPSKILQFIADKYNVKSEYGVEVDYTDPIGAAFYYIWYEKKLDIYKTWIERCRHNGINPWFSFRMNDAEISQLPNFYLSDYYYEHYLDFARVRHRKPEGVREFCRDYEIDNYRNQMLDYIDEILGNYDVYGIELDFQREICCFQIGREWDASAVMTDFMLKVKAIVQRAEEKHGHKIKVLVRSCANPRDFMEFGFDIGEWARLGLIDMVVPSPNWMTTDNDIPLKLWRRLMEPHGVSVIGCIEVNLCSSPEYLKIVLRDWQKSGLRKHSFETYCACAVNIMSQAPGALYLFNCMDYLSESLDYKGLLSVLGDFEKVINLPRRHVMTYNDTTLLWNKNESVLPIEYKENRESGYIKIVTGTVPKGKICVLRLGLSNDSEGIEVFVNSVKAEFIGTQECEAPILSEYLLYCFEIPEEAIQSCVQISEIVATNVTLDYADICVG